MSGRPKALDLFSCAGGATREQLKDRCRELCSAVMDWQMIAMVLADRGKDGLSVDDRTKLDNLIEAYND